MARYRAGLETRARILEATRDLLGENGLEGTTLKAICDRAEVGAGSFYNLFLTKEEAVLTVVREAITAVDTGAQDRAETVEDLVDAYLAFVTGEPVLARIYLQAAVAWGLGDPAVAGRFRRHQQLRVERFAAALVRGSSRDLDADEATTRAQLLLSTLNGLTVNWMLDPAIDLLGHRDRLLDLART